MTFSKGLFGEIAVAKPDISLLSNSRYIIVKPENICTPPVGAVSNRTEFGVKLIGISRFGLGKSC